MKELLIVGAAAVAYYLYTQSAPVVPVRTARATGQPASPGIDIGEPYPSGGGGAAETPYFNTFGSWFSSFDDGWGGGGVTGGWDYPTYRQEFPTGPGVIRVRSGGGIPNEEWTDDFTGGSNNSA